MGRLVRSVSSAPTASDARDEPTTDDATTTRPSPGGETPVRMWRHLQILGKVGEGGFAEVYRARDTTLDREVALKIVRPEVRDRVDQNVVIREGRLLASIKHPNVVIVYGADEHDGQLGMWMEFIAGRSLHAILEQHGPFSAREAALVGMDVCRALAAIHGKGIVHQDVKPQNVMREDGGRTVLMDLGVGVRSGTLPVGGTPRYRAPELRDGGLASTRSDLYSLGMLLYHLVTEQFPAPPPRGDAPSDAATSSGSLLRDVRPDLPESFVRVVERALASAPERRFASAGEMGKALLAFLEASGAIPVQRRPAPEPWRSEPKRSPRRAAAWALAAVALLAAAVAAGWWAQRRFPAPAPATVAVDRRAALPVAVLLFQNQTGDASLDWLRTGLAELMIVGLAQSPQLRVTSTDQVFQVFREMDSLQEAVTPPAVVERVAERFAARYVVVGSFFRAGSTYRLTVQIRDVASQRLASTEVAEGVGEASLFSLVDQLCRRIKTALGLAPEPEEQLERELSAVTTASTSALRYYAEALAMQYSGKTAECLPLYEKAVEADPQFALALSKVSLLYFRLGREREGTRFSERAMANLGRLSARERSYVEGNHYSNRESTYDRAIQAYTRALGQYHDHWPARHNLAILFMDLERYPEAAAAWEVNRRERPDMLPLYRYLAFCQAAQGDFVAGHQSLVEMKSRQPRPAQALVELGSYLAQGGRTAEAMATFAQAEASPAARADVDEQVWGALLLAEDWPALAAWRERAAAERDPYRRGRLALSQAVVLLHRGRSQEALAMLARAAKGYPEAGRTTAALHALRARVLLETGRPAPALAASSVARRDGRGDRGEWEGLYLASLAHLALGERERAQAVAADLARETVAVPGQKEERRHRHLLGQIAPGTDAAGALAHLAHAESLLPPRGVYLTHDHVPQHVPVWYSLAATHLRLGNLDPARAYFLKIVESHGERVLWPMEYVRSLYFLADIHDQRGEVAEAREARERFLAYWEAGDIDRERVEETRAKLGRRQAVLNQDTSRR
jgi:serine/threonine-protein kinase